MKKIAVLTTGRWDYAHLYWIIDGLNNADWCDLTVLKPVNHTENIECKSYDLFQLLSVEDYPDIWWSAYIYFTEKEYDPDLLVVLGDRFETHAVVSAALLCNIKIAHIHGGEITDGAFDNNLRDSITCMSDYHFTAHPTYGARVLDILGWSYKIKTAFTVGAPILDWFEDGRLLERWELPKHIIRNSVEPYIVACFNPVTKELENTVRNATVFLEALSQINMNTVLFQPNIDPENDTIRNLNEMYWCDHKNWCLLNSIEPKVYLSLLKHAEFIIGNSSSGIIESSGCNLPAVNIGNRQEGRLMGANVFNCDCDIIQILNAIGDAINYRARKEHTPSMFGYGASDKIIEEIRRL